MEMANIANATQVQVEKNNPDQLSEAGTGNLVEKLFNTRVERHERRKLRGWISREHRTANDDHASCSMAMLQNNVPRYATLPLTLKIIQLHPIIRLISIIN